MKCEICHKNEASIHFKQVMNDEAHELFICRECAKENGIDPQSPMDLTDFLFGVGVQTASPGAGSELVCAACGMRLADFRKHARLGCSVCYEVFADEIDEMMRGMHRGEQHQGKVPASMRNEAEIAGLQRALDVAVEDQDFEEAAKLRDRIRELQAL